MDSLQYYFLPLWPGIGKSSTNPLLLTVELNCGWREDSFDTLSHLSKPNIEIDGGKWRFSCFTGKPCGEGWQLTFTSQIWGVNTYLHLLLLLLFLPGCSLDACLPWLSELEIWWEKLESGWQCLSSSSQIVVKEFPHLIFPPAAQHVQF